MATRCLEISQGEIADRMTILEIKAQRIGDAVRPELEAVNAAWNGGHGDDVQRLREINAEAWECVEKIYSDFASGMGDDEWRLTDIGAAEASIRNFRKAHLLNMARVEVKNRINNGAGYRELKTWNCSTT
jgi:hypothetical protein